MKGENVFLKIIVVAILFSLIFAAAGNAVDFGTLGFAEGYWDDEFNDDSKIDDNPPGDGQSDNYVVGGGVVKMTDTYTAWDDPAFTKMKIITVTNNAGSQLDDYALEMTVNYDSDMQPDYEDLRFRHENAPGEQLSHWIESYTGSSANVWVNIPTLPTGSSEIYMLYGNSAAEDDSDFSGIFSDWDEEWSGDEKITLHSEHEGTWDPDVEYGGGEFLIAWEEGQAWYPPYTYGYKQEIRASMYQPDGTRVVNDKLVYKDNSVYYRNENPSIAYGGGNFFVAWERYGTQADPDPSTMDIYARTVQRSGSELTLGSVINVCTQNNIQADANVEFDSVNNRFLVVWEDARQGTSNYNIYGQLYSTSGTPVGGEKTISSASDSQCEPWVAFDSINERYCIVWEEGETPNDGPFDIWFGLFDKNVNPIGSPTKLADGNSNTDYNFPCVCFNSQTEEYLVTWNEGDISEEVWRGDVWAHIIDSDGDTVKDNFVLSEGSYIRTDIEIYPMTEFDNPYIVTYDNGNVIYGKLVSANGIGGDTDYLFSVDTDADGDWANIGVYNGKVFVAWEDVREPYPQQYDFFPDVFGNIFEEVTQSGLSVSTSFGSEIDIVLTAHVTSVKITKPSDDYWDDFDAIFTGNDISYSILHGTSGDTLMEDVQPGDGIGSLTTNSIRLMATFTRTAPSSSPELDYWKVTWIENDSPNTPSNPDPSNGEDDVEVDTDLSWTCSDPDGDDLTYDVYFGANSNPPLAASGIDETTYDPGTLDYGVTYYWKIKAIDPYGGTTTGPVWHFTTWINTAPNVPSNPDPYDGETNVNVQSDISWTCSDPDGDALYYDIYFGTSSNPPLIGENLGQNVFDPGQMEFTTKYYWKIVAEDVWGAETAGPIWSFTTGSNNPPNSPSSPQPPSGSTNVDVEADLSWSCSDPDGDELVYDIYFGTSSDPPLVYVAWPETTYDPGVMDFDQKYYWKIVAEDIYGEQRTGPKWSFTTGHNDPPNTPSNPSPADGSENIPLDITLSWSGGDPNPGDTVLYDLYFSTNNPPTIWKRDLEVTSVSVQNMQGNTKYYWKVIAKDSHHEQAEGPKWFFITQDENQNGPPNTPTIQGPVLVKVNEAQQYQIHATDPEGEDVFYQINWGDETTDWLGPYPSGQDQSFTHTWTGAWKPYIINVGAKDTNGNKCKNNGILPIVCSRSVRSNMLINIINRIFENRPILDLLNRVIPILERIIYN